MGAAHRAEEAGGNQLENRSLPGGQGGQIRFGGASGNSERVMVGHLFAVADQRGVNLSGRVHAADGGGRRRQGRDAGLHIIRKIPAVGSGVGGQLLFIKALEVVEGLLGGVAEQPVGLPLEGGQVAELRGAFGFVRSRDLPHRDGLSKAGGPRALRLRLGGITRADCPEAAAVQLDGIKFLRPEPLDRRLAFGQQGQRRGEHAAHVQDPALMERREQTGGVDAHQPVRLGAAEGGVVKAVILGAVPQILKALPNRALLHRGNPEPLKGLAAAAFPVDQTEDQLAFSSRVRRADQGGNVIPAHELAENFHLLSRVRQRLKLPGGGEDREIVQAPPGVAGVVGVRRSERHQMADAPAHQPAVSLQITVLPSARAQHLGDAHCDGGLFRYN